MRKPKQPSSMLVWRTFYKLLVCEFGLRGPYKIGSLSQTTAMGAISSFGKYRKILGDDESYLLARILATCVVIPYINGSESCLSFRHANGLVNVMTEIDAREISRFATDLLRALPPETHSIVVRIFREAMPKACVTYNAQKKSCKVEEI